MKLDKLFKKKKDGFSEYVRRKSWPPLVSVRIVGWEDKIEDAKGYVGDDELEVTHKLTYEDLFAKDWELG